MGLVLVIRVISADLSPHLVQKVARAISAEIQDISLETARKPKATTLEPLVVVLV